MIDFKPSARLGLLNEEDFTSNPAARGWTVTTSTYTVSYDANGIGLKHIDDVANPRECDLIINKKTQQYISFTAKCQASALANWSEGPRFRIYIDDILIMDSNNITNYIGGTASYPGQGTFNVFKNTKNQWIFYYGGGRRDTDANAGTYNYNPNKNSGNTLKIKINSMSGSATPIMYLTNLKWV